MSSPPAYGKTFYPKARSWGATRCPWSRSISCDRRPCPFGWRGVFSKNDWPGRGQASTNPRRSSTLLEAIMKTTMSLSLVLGLALAVPAQDAVKQRLEKSPRHHEWVQVKNGERTV